MRGHLSFLGANIKRLRKQRGWTQLELATKSDISRIALIHIESGKALPSLETLTNLSHTLHVPVAQLLAAGPAEGESSGSATHEHDLHREIEHIREMLLQCSPRQVSAFRKIVIEFIEACRV